MPNTFTASIYDLFRDGRMDAEYFRPEFQAVAATLAAQATDSLVSVARVSDGNHAAISHLFTSEPEGNHRYLRGQDLGGFFLSSRNPVFVPPGAFATLQSSLIRAGDVLLSIVGTVGAVSLVPADSSDMTGSCKIAVLQPFPRTIRPEYLAAFLASAYGHGQLRRLTRGAVQTGLLLADMKHIRVPRLGHTEDLVADDVASAYLKLRDAQRGLAECREWLADKLGFSALPELRGVQCRSAGLADLVGANRWDAEYFQPIYSKHARRVLRITEIKRLVPVRTVLADLTNGHTPAHHDLSVGDVHFLTAENVRDYTIDFGTAKRITARQHTGELGNTRLQRGDVLFNIKGRVGDCAPVEFLPVKDVNINQDVARLRLHPGHHPYFFAAWFNSRLGRPFVWQSVTGAINPFVGLNTLKRLLYPDVDSELQHALGEEVRANIQGELGALTDATTMLASAIATVEHHVKARGDPARHHSARPTTRRSCGRV